MKDELWRQMATTVGMPKSDFLYDQDGLLVSIYAMDREVQILVHVSLRRRFLRLSH